LRFVGLGFGAAWQVWFGSVRWCPARSGTACRGVAGSARYGTAQQVGVSQGLTWLDVAGMARSVRSRRDLMRLGRRGLSTLGVSCLRLAWHRKSRRGRHGKACCGLARFGTARCGRLGGSSLVGRVVAGMVRFGPAWLGLAWPGTAWQGMAGVVGRCSASPGIVGHGEAG